MQKTRRRILVTIVAVLGTYFLVLVPVVTAITHPRVVKMTPAEYAQVNPATSTTVGNDTAAEKYYTLKLFGFIPLKKVRVELLPFNEVCLGGVPIGICGQTDGVIVTADTANRKIRKGDVIQAVNGEKITNLADFCAKTADLSRCQVTFQRQGKKLTKEIDPAVLRLRDETRGVGMLTYLNPANQTFSALGHQMGDFETGATVNLTGGAIYPVEIFGVEKTQNQTTGVLQGQIRQSAPAVGSITQGTEFGVAGCLTANSPLLAQCTTTLPVATRYQVKPGKAVLRTSLDGATVEEFSCEIIKPRWQTRPGSKSMIIRLTDERLLAKTGGIIHGMSGSPIIQDGHLVGALTHAITRDPAKGYAIYVDFLVT